MRHVARKGYNGETGRMTPNECVEVVEYVIDMACHEHGRGHRG